MLGGVRVLEGLLGVGGQGQEWRGMCGLRWVYREVSTRGGFGGRQGDCEGVWKLEVASPVVSSSGMRRQRLWEECEAKGC